MPTKKAQAAADPQVDAAANDSVGGIEAWELPKSLVTKIAKSVVGDSGAGNAGAGGSRDSLMPTKFTKDATLSMVKGSTVFINYVAATAHDIAISRSHKTISAADVIKALEQLEFGDIAALMPSELDAYRALEKAKKAGGSTSKKGKEKEKAPAAEASGSGSGSGSGKLMLTIPGGQKKSPGADQAGAAASAISGQADSMVVEDDGGGEDDVEEGDDIVGGEDENDMDVDEDEADG